MKRILNVILCFLLIAITCFTTSCSKNSNNDNNSSNETYYKNLGYHYITTDENTIIKTENDIITISTNKFMIEHNATISLKFNMEQNLNIKFNNGNYVNFATGEILSRFVVNHKFYEINDTTIIVKEDLDISATSLEFFTIGISLECLENNNEKPILKQGKLNHLTDIPEEFLSVYAQQISNSSFNFSKLISNTSIKYHTTSLTNNKFEIDLAAEIYLNTININLYLILCDSENKYYLHKITTPNNFLDSEFTISNLSNIHSNLNAIKLTLTHDLTVKDDYEPI